MDHDLDVVVIQSEQVVSLDYLKPLVHQGGGIHGDFASHAPVGVTGCIGHRCLLEIG